MSNIFPKLTVGCERECRIAYTGGTTTLAHVVSEYDKHGALIPGHNPNRTTSTYTCSVCGARWTVEHQDGQDIIKRHEAAA